jgi:disulfide bond formation protein DsbB
MGLSATFVIMGSGSRADALGRNHKSCRIDSARAQRYAGPCNGEGPMSASARRNPASGVAIAIAVIATAAILGAFFFQYVLGLQPCPLCLEQRIAYYVAIPLALIAALAASRGWARALLAAALVVIALAMLINAGLAVYHAGVEWKFWPGPADCSGPITNLGRASDLAKQLRNVSVVRCDEAPWRFLGLSLAGYNVLISLALAGIAMWGAARAPRTA